MRACLLLAIAAAGGPDPSSSGSYAAAARIEHGPTFGTAHKGCWTPPSCGGPGAPGCACRTFPQGVEVPVYNTSCDSPMMATNREGTAVVTSGTAAGFCVMQHLWTGGSAPAGLYGSYRIRYYIDGEKTASVNLPIGLATGQPYGDNDGPWSAGPGGELLFENCADARRCQWTP